MVSILPVSDMIDQVLFKHEAPAFDDVEQSLAERFGIHTEPCLEYCCPPDSLNLLIDLLIRVNLQI